MDHCTENSISNTFREGARATNERRNYRLRHAATLRGSGYATYIPVPHVSKRSEIKCAGDEWLSVESPVVKRGPFWWCILIPPYIGSASCTLQNQTKSGPSWTFDSSIKSNGIQLCRWPFSVPPWDHICSCVLAYTHLHSPTLTYTRLRVHSSTPTLIHTYTRSLRFRVGFISRRVYRRIFLDRHSRTIQCWIRCVFAYRRAKRRRRMVDQQRWFKMRGEAVTRIARWFRITRTRGAWGRRVQLYSEAKATIGRAGLRGVFLGQRRRAATTIQHMLRGHWAHKVGGG